MGSRLLQFLSAASMAALAYLSLGPLAAAAEPKEGVAGRPNILFALADDWSRPHAGAYGDKVVHTPVFDRVAREGMLFQYAFCMTPSCTASRATLLTGQAGHRLEESGKLRSILRKKYDCYPDLLEAAGYHVGHTRKGWGPGSLEGSGRTRNPAGPAFKDFATFFAGVPKGKPFCFWFGSRDPHRIYVKGSGVKSGMKLEEVSVPPYLPDTPETRSDICDYYFAVQRYDREVGEMLTLLERAGQLDNTIVVMTGDNGWPFPRGKANLYDAGTRMPLAIRWPARLKGGQTSDAFISFQDFASTFLEAAGLKPPSSMTGRSFLDLLSTGKVTPPDIRRDRVFLERERHVNARKGDLGYPSRAIRTREFLYILNMHPERWPAGDPEAWKATEHYGDIDAGPTKEEVLAGKDGTSPKGKRLFELSCGKRPAEELYEIASDPHQMTNLADNATLAETKKKLRRELEEWMKQTDDPRANGDDPRWDKYPYFGPPPDKKK